ncbi:hypothetical protein MY11210_005602 [Beauveria gryllotalpidicola]
MTEPSGYFQYHCKYFNSPRNCPKWVWINNAACQVCIADGFDDEPLPAATRTASRDFLAPHVNNGILQYAHMEVAVSEQGEEGLVMRSKTLRSPPPPAIPVTTMMPRGGGALVASTL